MKKILQLLMRWWLAALCCLWIGVWLAFGVAAWKSGVYWFAWVAFGMASAMALAQAWGLRRD